MTKGDNASAEQRSMETGLMYAEIDINTPDDSIVPLRS